VRPLSATDMLTIWEVAREQHPLDRALTVLAAALPSRTRSDLAVLGIGERDRLLLDLRERTIGPNLDGVATCGTCGARIEFQFKVAQVRLPFAPAGHVFAIDSGSGQWCVRMPNSTDLAAVVGAPNRQSAIRSLAARCVTTGCALGQADQATESALDLLGSRMNELDPQADVHLDLSCPACGHSWQALLDIAGFFWMELAAGARHLLSEVHALARAYGWSEADILALSPARRQTYLELIGA
jgi:hypothetical protein